MAKYRIPFSVRFAVHRAVVRACLAGSSQPKSTERLTFFYNEAGLKPGSDIIFFGNCLNYWNKYGQYLAESAFRNDPESHIHVHFFVERAGEPPALDLSRFGDRLSATFEPGTAVTFIMLARFICLARLVDTYGCNVLAFDADTLINRSLGPLFSELARNDAALFLRARSAKPWKAKPWRRVWASGLGIAASAKGQRFATAMARTIEATETIDCEYPLDQLALFYLYRWAPLCLPGTRFMKLTKEHIDWDFAEDALVWSAKGRTRKGEANAFQELLGAYRAGSG